MDMNGIFKDTKLKTIIGILMILPLITGLYLYTLLPMSPLETVSPSDSVLLPFGLTIILALPMIISLYHLYNIGQVEKNKKTLWAIFLIVFHIIAMPLYFYLHIWKK